MAAFNMDNGRHRNAVQVREGMASGERKPVTGVRVSMKSSDTRTTEERKQDNAADAERLGVSRMFFI